MAAVSGIAPDSPRLQRGANLSQLHSHGSSARYCAAVFRLSGGGSAFELRRNGKWVARRGNAPRSAGCEPAVLRLNYRAKEWRSARDSNPGHRCRCDCFQDSVLDQPDALREMGSPTWTRTTTTRLTDGHAALTSSGIWRSRQDLHLRGSV